MICDADKVSIRYNKMRKKNRHGRQAADRMELQHATFERSLRTMSEKIVTLNEEVIKGANQGTSTGKRRRDAERVVGSRSGEADAGGAL